MWALRRASNPFKLRGLSVGTSHACCGKSEILFSCLDSKTTITGPYQALSESHLFYHTTNVCSKFFMGRRSLSSQAGAESSESEELEDGFSERETPYTAGATGELVSEPELSEDDNDVIEEPSQSPLELLDTETYSGEKTSLGERAPSELFKAINAAPSAPLHSVLENWLAEGKGLDRAEISLAMIEFRKRRMYVKALQLLEWLEANKQLDFTERDFASHLDLIAKVGGLQRAENYIYQIPESFRGEVVYRTLLANYVSSNNVKKAEEVFNKMKDLEFPISRFACEQLLLLYKRFDKSKIADVLLLMEKENVKPSVFTYNILIDAKGLSNDITGMDQIVEKMKAEGIEPHLVTHAILANHYISSGLKERAKAIMIEMEGDNLKERRRACRSLLPLYAALGNADEVERVWKVCEMNPRLAECMAAISAWGKLKEIDKAEAVFERMSTAWKLSAKNYSSLLKIYVNHSMLAKGIDLVKRMGDSGCRVGPLAWDSLIRLYVGAGEVEKADSILHNAAKQNQMKPIFSSYMVIMDQYAKRGDIHNAEKIFFRMRQAGYEPRVNQFQTLIQTYINAKAPAYGIRERMKADNIFPQKALAAQLAQVDAFRKTAVSDLLD